MWRLNDPRFRSCREFRLITQLYCLWNYSPGAMQLTHSSRHPRGFSIRSSFLPAQSAVCSSASARLSENSHLSEKWETGRRKPMRTRRDSPFLFPSQREFCLSVLRVSIEARILCTNCDATTVRITCIRTNKFRRVK